MVPRAVVVDALVKYNSRVQKYTMYKNELNHLSSSLNF